AHTLADRAGRAPRRRRWRRPRRPPLSPTRTHVRAARDGRGNASSVLGLQERVTSSSTSQHLAMLAMPRRTSRGSSVLQRGTASGQRGWKGHPAGRFARLGGWPAIEYRGSLLPSFGTEPSKARVYGCPGWSNSSRTGACSMIWPAYMTATLSHLFATIPVFGDARPRGGERGLRHRSADGAGRVQRRHGILQDHGDPPATDPAQLGLTLPRQGLALEDAAATHDAGGTRQEPDDRKAGRRLAAARFTDEPECLALVQAEAHAIHGLDDAGSAEREEVRLEVGDFENGGHALAEPRGISRRAPAPPGCPERWRVWGASSGRSAIPPGAPAPPGRAQRRGLGGAISGRSAMPRGAPAPPRCPE